MVRPLQYWDAHTNGNRSLADGRMPLEILLENGQISNQTGGEHRNNCLESVSRSVVMIVISNLAMSIAKRKASGFRITA